MNASVYLHLDNKEAACIRADVGASCGHVLGWLDVEHVHIALYTVAQGRALLEAARELCGWLEQRDVSREEA